MHVPRLLALESGHCAIMGPESLLQNKERRKKDDQKEGYDH